jgi:hypothetical protein
MAHFCSIKSAPSVNFFKWENVLQEEWHDKWTELIYRIKDAEIFNKVLAKFGLGTIRENNQIIIADICLPFYLLFILCVNMYIDRTVTVVKERELALIITTVCKLILQIMNSTWPDAWAAGRGVLLGAHKDLRDWEDKR